MAADNEAYAVGQYQSRLLETGGRFEASLIKFDDATTGRHGNRTFSMDAANIKRYAGALFIAGADSE